MKNSRKPLIIISMALLLAVVLAMSGVTFAKYITVDRDNNDSATVAKWGWTLSADASTLFSTDYDDTLVTADPDAGTLVISADDDEVVAPGTSGKMEFSIHNGTGVNNDTEVRTKVDVIILDGAEDAAFAETTLTVTPTDGAVVTYNPLKWTITKDGAATSVTNGSIADVQAYLEGLAATVEPNTDYAGAGNYVISWKWVDAGDGANDVYDTALGSIAAGVSADTDAATYTADLGITFGFGIVITQVQDVVVP